MDGSAHDVLHTNPLFPTPASVRVQCEAADCGALLEIEVPACQSPQTPVIVRCGNCQRLLEVWLHKETRAVASQSRLLSAEYASSLKRNTERQTSPYLDYQIISGDGMETKKTHGLISRHQLLKPPPLSRAHQVLQYESPKFRLLNQSNIRSSNASPSQVTSACLSMPPMHSQTNSYQRSAFSGGQSHISQDSLLLTENVDSKTRKSNQSPTFRDNEIMILDRQSRHPSPYNRFMSREVKRIKLANPEVDHRRAFRMAASNWARSPNTCQLNFPEYRSCHNNYDQQSIGSVVESNDGQLNSVKKLDKTEDVTGSSGSPKGSENAM